MLQTKFPVIKKVVMFFAVVAMFAPVFVQADVILPHIFSSSMVIQRDMPVPVWGWADPGEKVTVKIGDNVVSASADSKGSWTVKLPAMKAGGPFEMTVTGKNTIKLTDILAGEVWVCSGQSNMEMGVGMVMNGKQEIADANYPQIRLFQILKKTSGQPVKDVDATWKVCTPETIAEGGWGGFSAASFFFGRELYKKLNVPVGLINTSWGGSRIEPWTPPEGFKAVPALQDIAKQVNDANINYRKNLPENIDKLDAWVKDTRKALAANEDIPQAPDWPNHPLNGYALPTAMYNQMIFPIVPFAMRGAIWYQGESNRGEGMLYFEKMKGLINGWRTVWGEGDFPFYYVQLAPYRYGGNPVKPELLAEIWEAQTASLSIPNTGMAGTMDIGNVVDIHPTNKQEVGRRLALWAFAKTYGFKDIVYSGPIYKSMKTDGNKIIIDFDYTGAGLASRDNKPLTWFEIAGADKKFVKAQAKISGNTVIVSSPNVLKPQSVRFGWNEEAEPNLMNKEGLPASPFRTDKN